jgi:hypothetical protein
MYFIVGNPETPAESGVSSASISAVFPPIFFLASFHAFSLAAQWGHPFMKNKTSNGRFLSMRSASFFRAEPCDNIYITL